MSERITKLTKCRTCGNAFQIRILKSNESYPQRWPSVCPECKGINPDGTQADELRSTRYHSILCKKNKPKKPSIIQINSASFDRKYREFCKKHNVSIEEEEHPKISRSQFLKEKNAAAKHFEDISYKYVHAAEIEAERRRRRIERNHKAKICEEAGKD